MCAAGEGCLLHCRRQMPVKRGNQENVIKTSSFRRTEYFVSQGSGVGFATFYWCEIHVATSRKLESIKKAVKTNIEARKTDCGPYSTLTNELEWIETGWEEGKDAMKWIMRMDQHSLRFSGYCCANGEGLVRRVSGAAEGREKEGQ